MAKGDKLGRYIDERIAALNAPEVQEMTPYEKALCEKACLEDREKIAANLDLEAAAIKKNGEGAGEPKFHWLAAERTEYIADQIRRGVL